MTGPAPLVATRLPLDPGPPLDPFVLAGEDGILVHAGGRALVGLGTATTLDLPGGLEDGDGRRRASEALAAIPCDERFDPHTSGVIAFAALPFDRSAAAALVVPQIVYGAERSGAEWVTLLAPRGSSLPTSSTGLRAWLAGATPVTGPGPPPPARPGPSPRVVPLRPDTSFVAMVEEALAAIARGEVRKVVLARRVDATLAGPVGLPALLRRWQRLEPNVTIFSVPTDDGRFIGASPELLVERTGASVHSRPLAGTAGRPAGLGGPDGDLLGSPKDAVEHELVVEAIAAVLDPLCSELQVPAGPELVQLHNLVHLGTSIRGTLADGPGGHVPTALELVGVLHPTPAVGGVPSAPALALIDRLEPESRGHYAGPVGWLDARGDGRWVVGIRAMTLAGRTARLTAGVGIVEGSRPEAELIETELKLTAVLDVLEPDPTTVTRWPVGHHPAAG